LVKVIKHVFKVLAPRADWNNFRTIASSIFALSKMKAWTVRKAMTGNAWVHQIDYSNCFWVQHLHDFVHLLALHFATSSPVWFPWLNHFDNHHRWSLLESRPPTRHNLQGQFNLIWLAPLRRTWHLLIVNYFRALLSKTVFGQWIDFNGMGGRIVKIANFVT
jgi:hypothetical protein